jgi:hypothetical protein
MTRLTKKKLIEVALSLEAINIASAREKSIRHGHGVCAEARERAAEATRRTKALAEKLDHLDEAFLFARSIDQSSYEQQRDKLRVELTPRQDRSACRDGSGQS